MPHVLCFVGYNKNLMRTKSFFQSSYPGLLGSLIQHLLFFSFILFPLNMWGPCILISATPNLFSCVFNAHVSARTSMSYHRHCVVSTNLASWRGDSLEKPSWCRNEQVCQGGQTVCTTQRCERSNVLDTALYKNYLFYHFPVHLPLDVHVRTTLQTLSSSSSTHSALCG